MTLTLTNQTRCAPCDKDNCDKFWKPHWLDNKRVTELDIDRPKCVIQFCYSANIFLLLNLIYFSNSCPLLGPSWSATSGSVLSKNNAAGRNIATGRPSMQLSQTTFVLLPPTPIPVSGVSADMADGCYHKQTPSSLPNPPWGNLSPDMTVVYACSSLPPLSSPKTFSIWLVKKNILT